MPGPCSRRPQRLPVPVVRLPTRCAIGMGPVGEDMELRTYETTIDKIEGRCRLRHTFRERPTVSMMQVATVEKIQVPTRTGRG